MTSHIQLFKGISIETKQPVSIAYSRISTTKWTKILAEATRAWSFGLSPGIPKTWVALRSGCGVLAPWRTRACGNGLSRARLPVPQGNARWIPSGCVALMCCLRHDGACWSVKSRMNTGTRGTCLLWLESTGILSNPTRFICWLSLAHPAKFS